MTLIVGIKCEEGIVLGADGAATSGVMGQNTIRQTHNKKLKILENSIVVGVSGSVGLGQRITGTVGSLYKEGKLFKAPNTSTNFTSDQIMTNLRLEFWKQLEMEFQIARAASQLLQPNVTMMSALTSTVVALKPPSQASASLFSFDQQAAPEEATAQLPFVAIGSGQMIADPFLAFIRRLFWPDRAPTIAEGIFAVYWTLHHAIETNPGGVADPKQVVVLKLDGATWRAKEHAEDEGQEHMEHVVDIERKLTSFEQVGSGQTTPPPVLPASLNPDGAGQAAAPPSKAN